MHQFVENDLNKEIVKYGLMSSLLIVTKQNYYGDFPSM